MSIPSNTIAPALGGYSPTMQRAAVDFPQPDSPTREKVSPRLMVKLTPSSALTQSRGLPCTSRSKAEGDASK